MLEFDDIQHILLTRAPALTGRYEFLTFRNAGGARAWVAAILDKVHSAAAARASVESSQRWVTVAFTWNGLRVLGVDEPSLATFPEEFRQGMVTRANMLGDTGLNAPEHWVGGLANPALHAIVMLFALIKSGLPSPFTSAVVTDTGAGPTPGEDFRKKFPLGKRMEPPEFSARFKLGKPTPLQWKLPLWFTDRRP